MRKVPATEGSPLVSVIVPTYNRPDVLPDCLRSILGQTYRNIEIVVVNDAGIDVKAIIESLNEKRNIAYIEHPRNRGIAAARNSGVAAASGKYIAYLDDDDLYYPDHVESLVSALENSGFNVAYTDACRRNLRSINGRDIVTRRDVPYSFDFDSDHLLVRNFIPTLCILHEKSCLEDTGLFDETLPVLEDWDLWIRMSRLYPFRHIRKVTCEFAWKTDGDTLTSGRRALFRQTVEVIYAKSGAFARENPRVQRARSKYLKGMRFLSFLSGLLGEESASFRWIQNGLTSVYNFGERLRR